jgi:uncharacterized protein YjeT (DUF2065 family)
MTPKYYGVFLVVLGIIYNLKPNIFRIGFWKKTDIAQNKLSEKNYTIYMRVLGVVFIVIGVIIFFVKK